MRHDRFDELFRDLYVPAFLVARRILGNEQESEDAACEALARTAASWRRIRDLPYQRAWVLRVTANVATDALRRRRPVADVVDVDPGATGPNAEDRLVLAHALARLPRRQREVLVLRFLADLTETQVADQLCISRSSVKEHCRRGLEALRQGLDVTLGVSIAF